MKISKLMSWKGALSTLSLLFGIVFYIAWSSSYNSWMDISSYSIAVPFSLLGVFGILLTLLQD